MISTASPLSSATLNVAYSTTVVATGGTAPYTWAITAASPNTGGWLSIGSSTGIIAGTPGTLETESVTVRVTDNFGTQVSKTFSLVVTNSVSSPANVIVVGSGPTSNLLTWGNSSIGTGELLWQYRIYRATSIGGTYTKVGVAQSNYWSERGLSNSTTYYYKVDCQDEAGTTSAQSVSATYLPGATATLAAGAGADFPNCPTIVINSRYTAPVGGTTWTVTRASNTATTVPSNVGLQYALNNAALGDTIIVNTTSTDAGGVYDGGSTGFTMPDKGAGTNWIYVKGQNYASLPAPGTRVTTANASVMPKIINNVASTGQTSLFALPKAHHFRWVGINFQTITGQLTFSMIRCFSGSTLLSDQPHDITFDRCLVVAFDPAWGGVHGIYSGCDYFAVVDCGIYGWASIQNSNDSQAVLIATSQGPVKIKNCRLEAESENVMSGGVNPSVAGLVPSDISVTDNLMFKPLSWAVGRAFSASKNLYEIKSGARTYIVHNRLENMWNSGQPWCISFKSTNSGADQAAAVCDDTLCTANRFVNVSRGPTIHAGNDTGGQNTPTRWSCIWDNVFEITGLDTHGTNLDEADAFLINSVFEPITGNNPYDPRDTIMDHNTFINFQAPSLIFYGMDIECNAGITGATFAPPYQWFRFKNNIMTSGQFGWARKGGVGVGTACLSNNFNTNYAFTGNVAINESSGGTGYPAGNFYPANNTAVGFVGGALASPATNVSDYALTGGSAYHGSATDGTDIGANISKVAL